MHLDKFWFTQDFQESALTKAFQNRLVKAVNEAGFVETQEVNEANTVFQVVSDTSRPFRRRNYAVYVIGVLFQPSLDTTQDLLKQFYSTHIRSLSNILIVVAGNPADPAFVITTLERGAFLVSSLEDVLDIRYHKLVERIAPLMRSHLIIRNRFESDLSPSLWNGTRETASLSRAGQILESWDLLPTPFPMQDYLSVDEMARFQEK